MKRLKIILKDEKTGGVLLLCCTLFSLLLANSVFSESYDALWHFHIGGHSLSHWINDALMAVFFLLVGLELVREMHEGELSSLKTAMLPFSAALGGMIFPACIYLLFNGGSPTQSGFGIPTATDIAFALGVLSLLGNRVPLALKVFLMALAVIDDLGAIVVIALFYSSSLNSLYLGLGLGVFALLLILNKKFHITNVFVYIAGGIALWYFIFNSGIHATISGVLLAITIPIEKRSETCLSARMQHALHIPVHFIILPLFALTNTAISIKGDFANTLHEPFAAGIMLGLIFGKPLGIMLFSFLSVKTKLCSLPSGVKWKQLFGVGLLGGVGFTMSIFITMLAFGDNAHYTDGAKLTVLLSSLIAGIAGFLWLKVILRSAK
ncbi:MAG: Na+/H+ antiporter NhaA [Prevotellaceae bacterium]|jgi:NhaA family Na+:H+ antiporter|nr:Na+/H+ antiporter NhaA [Prevotellaceae bacterium]